jgi:sulfur-oxidizing protein SoxY
MCAAQALETLLPFVVQERNIRPARPAVEGVEEMTVTFNRRQILATSIGAVAAAGLIGSAGPALANDAADLVKAFAGGKSPASGKVKIDMPEIAENGNTVPMTILVDSPMTEQSYVQEVLVVADGNPNGGVVTFHFTPLSGVAEANTRIRLAKSQKITAVAKMSDGSLFTASKDVKVTIGGCGG